MDKEKHVYNVFEAVAGGYDSANARISLGLHLRWKRAAADFVLTAVPPDGRVLDLCCGTGDIAALLLESRGDISVTGLDFSPAMLAVACERFSGDSRVALKQGNALALPFEDASFDGAVISFGLRNTSDYGRVLAETARVVRPGGLVCCIDSFTPGSKLVRPFYALYFTRLMPLLGGGTRHRREYLWLSRSTGDFIPARELSLLMREKGLRKVKEKRYMMGACVCLCAVKESAPS